MMNYLVILLDSVRYDNFVEAETPNIDSLGQPRKVYSAGCWTIPSLVNLLITGAHIGSGPFLPHNPPSWIPSLLQKKGYHCVFLHANPWVTAHKHVFSRGFHELIDFKESKSIKQMVKHALEVTEKPFFMLMLVMDTHYVKPEGFLGGSQVRAIEHVDSELGQLFNRLENTRVIVTSDHGDSKQGHNPIKLKDFDIKLFEVPIVVGDIV